MEIVFPPLVEELFEEPYLAPYLLKAWAAKQGMGLGVWDANLAYFDWISSSSRLNHARQAFDTRLRAPFSRGEPERIALEGLARLCGHLNSTRERWRREDKVRRDLFSACRILEEAADAVAQSRSLPESLLGFPTANERSLESSSEARLWSALETHLAPMFPEMDLRAWAQLESFVDSFTALDPFIDDCCLPRLGNSPLVGFSVAMEIQVLPALRMARALRAAYPGVTIVLGGAFLSMTPAENLGALGALEFVDFLCIGEGETVVVEMLRRLRAVLPLEETPGLSYVENFKLRTNPAAPEPSLDELPMPLFDPEVLAALPRGTSLPISYARGCYWGKCTFCNFPAFSGLQSADVFVATLRQMVETYGIRKFSFIGDSMPAAFAEKVSTRLLEQKLKLSWWAYCKIEKSFVQKDHLIPLMARAGCAKLTIGVETLVDRLLEYVRKGYTWNLVLPQIRQCFDQGIRVKMNLIWDLPTTTEEEALLTLERARELEPYLGTLAVFTFRLSHHSPMQRQPEQFGLTLSPESPSGVLSDRGMDPGTRRRVYLRMLELGKRVPDSQSEELRRWPVETSRVELNPTAIVFSPSSESRLALFIKNGSAHWLDLTSLPEPGLPESGERALEWYRNGLLRVRAAPPSEEPAHPSRRRDQKHEPLEKYRHGQKSHPYSTQSTAP